MKSGNLAIAVATALLALTLGAATPARAATLDFSGFGFNQNLGAQVVLPEATITATTGTILRPFLVNGFCFVVNDGCVSSGTVAFTTPVSNLVFAIFATGPGESTDITVTAPGGATSSLNVAVDGNVDLSSYGLIASLTLSSIASGGAGGTAFRDFTFDIAPVPEPATFALMLTALAGGALIRSRRPR